MWEVFTSLNVVYRLEMWGFFVLILDFISEVCVCVYASLCVWTVTFELKNFDLDIYYDLPCPLCALCGHLITASHLGAIFWYSYAAFNMI